MEDFIWRTYARVVAYVELILSILASMVAFLITIAAGFLSTVFATDEEFKISSLPEVIHQHQHVAIWWMWGIVALLILITGLKLWASLKLLSATEFGMDVYEALERARVWRNVTFTFSVVQVVVVAVAAGVVGVAGLIGGVVYIVLAIIACYIIWRGSFILVVYKYMKELEDALASVGDAEVGYIYPDRVFVK